MQKVKQNLHLLKGSAETGKEEMYPSTRPNSETPRQQFKKVKLKRLVNKLNFINFQDGTILVVFKHTKYDHTDVI